jgi:hypothetical protein
MGATKPKAPAATTWVDCCLLSRYFSNIRINYSKICTAGSSVIECSCRDMKQYPPRVNRPTDTKNSHEILVHFLVNCCVDATSTTQYHPTYYKNAESCCLFNLRLLVQPKSQYWMLSEPVNLHDRYPPVPGELLVSQLHELLQYQCEWYKDVNINFLFVRTTWDSWKSHLLLMRLAASTKFLTRLIGFSASMNYGSLDTTLSKPSTPMLLTWLYTSDICRSWGGGVISWLTTPFALCTKTKEERCDWCVVKVVTSLWLTELVMHVCIDINILWHRSSLRYLVCI